MFFSSPQFYALKMHSVESQIEAAAVSFVQQSAYYGRVITTKWRKMKEHDFTTI